MNSFKLKRPEQTKFPPLQRPQEEKQTIHRISSSLFVVFYFVSLSSSLNVSSVENSCSALLGCAADFPPALLRSPAEQIGQDKENKTAAIQSPAARKRLAVEDSLDVDSFVVPMSVLGLLTLADEARQDARRAAALVQKISLSILEDNNSENKTINYSGLCWNFSPFESLEEKAKTCGQLAKKMKNEKNNKNYK